MVNAPVVCRFSREPNSPTSDAITTVADSASRLPPIIVVTAAPLVGAIYRIVNLQKTRDSIARRGASLELCDVLNNPPEYPAFVMHLECEYTGEQFGPDQIHGLPPAGKPLSVMCDLDCSGAALNVSSGDSMTEAADSRYRGTANTIAAPHIAGISAVSGARVGETTANGVRPVLGGATPS